MKTKKTNKKITVVSQFWPPNFVGGGEISTYHVCKELTQIGYEISIITSSASNNYLKFIKLVNCHPIEKLFKRKNLSQIIIREKLDDGIFWASDFFGAILTRDIHIKKVVTVRDYWPICGCSRALLKNYSFCEECNISNIIKCHKIGESIFLKKIIRTFRYLHSKPFRKSILPKFNHVVFVSNYIAKRIISKISLKKYSVIYNPLSREFINKEIINTKISNKILFAGTLIEYKGISILIKAMTEVAKNNKDILLLIAGTGDVYKYKNLTRKLGLTKNIKFLGKISYDNIINYYEKCDIVILSSLWFEPFGRTIIEGMARKCITIATNRGGPAEIIKNGENGFLYDVNDYRQLAKIIINLYQNPEMMGKIQEKARKFAVENFSPEKIAKKYERIFESV